MIPINEESYHKECKGCAFRRELMKKETIKPCLLAKQEYCPCRTCLVKTMGDSNCLCDLYEQTSSNYHKKYKEGKT